MSIKKSWLMRKRLDWFDLSYLQYRRFQDERRWSGREGSLSELSPDNTDNSANFSYRETPGLSRSGDHWDWPLRSWCRIFSQTTAGCNPHTHLRIWSLTVTEMSQLICSCPWYQSGPEDFTWLYWITSLDDDSKSWLELFYGYGIGFCKI